jgi:hypothetical protein
MEIPAEKRKFRLEDGKMSVSQNAAYAYSLFKHVKKIRAYGIQVKESINEDTRPGALMNLGIEGTLEIAGKALGTSLTSHPYFIFHKAHLEALAQALNASSNLDRAREALSSAIRSAEAAAALTGALADYRTRKNGLKVVYSFQIAGALLQLQDRGWDPQLKETVQTQGPLQAGTDRNIYEWRALWCDLFLNSVQLLAMAQVELRATEAAMKNFDEKMKALSSGGGMGMLGAAQMKKDREWQWYDRASKPGSGSEKAVLNPVGYARDQVNAIQELSDRLGEGCEAAMSDDAYRPDMMQHRLSGF